MIGPFADLLLWWTRRPPASPKRENSAGSALETRQRPHRRRQMRQVEGGTLIRQAELRRLAPQRQIPCCDAPTPGPQPFLRRFPALIMRTSSCTSPRAGRLVVVHARDRKDD